MLTLSNRQARQLLVRYHNLDGRDGLRGIDGVRAIMDRLGTVQFDPLNVAGRNADLALQARVRGYRPDMLRRLLYEERYLVDGYDKEMCVYTARDFGAFGPQRALHAADARNWLTGRGQGEAFDMLEDILAAIRERGPLSLTDIPTSIVKKYSDAVAWKNNNSYTGVDQVVCWPMAKLGEKIFHISSMVLGAIAQTDSANRDVPYESPSNKELPITGLCLSDGTEVRLALNEAEYLNGQGIVTAINFIGGWRTFGNRTGCYPGNTDPKDAFISSRRMVNWHGQTFILTYWQKLDKPTNKRLVQNVVDSENIRLNGLTASGALLGGRVEFLEEENPITDLIDGKIKFHTYLGLTVPTRDIEDIVEFDTSYFNTLFS